MKNILKLILKALVDVILPIVIEEIKKLIADLFKELPEKGQDTKLILFNAKFSRSMSSPEFLDSIKEKIIEKIDASF